MFLYTKCYYLTVYCAIFKGATNPKSIIKITAKSWHLGDNFSFKKRSSSELKKDIMGNNVYLIIDVL